MNGGASADKYPILLGRRFIFSIFLSLMMAYSKPCSSPSLASYGASGAVVNSPSVVRSLTLEEYLNLPDKKRRQFEGSFLSCTKSSRGQKACKPVSVIDGLLNDMREEEVEYLDLYNKMDRRDPSVEEKAKARLIQRQKVLEKLAAEPDWVNFAAAFSASVVSTLVMVSCPGGSRDRRRHPNRPLPLLMLILTLEATESTDQTIIPQHPLDTIKTLLMSKPLDAASGTPTGDEALAFEGEAMGNATAASGAADVLVAEVPLPQQEEPFEISKLYNGVFPNIFKEAPASALYLGIYEFAMTFLSQFTFFEEFPLLAYLLSGALGELIGSMIRAPAEAVKTRNQTGNTLTGSLKAVFVEPEGRKNTVKAWSSSLFRDVPAGAIQIAIFEVTKTAIINNPTIDFDVNTLFSEAVLGGLGGGIGAFLTTPSDVMTTKIISSAKSDMALKDVFAQVMKEDGPLGFFNGSLQRTAYWAFAIGIFLSVYCSLRQLSLQFFA